MSENTSRVVLVTGASSGFGRSIADLLRGDGYRVYGASRRAEGGDGHIRIDVTSDESVSDGVAAIVARERRLDAVVCNAGIGIAGALEDTSSAEALAQFDTNFFGAHRVVRAALPHLRRRERAHIVLIGSLAGRIGIPFQGMYSASKFALEGYCESLRLELKATGVRATILEPGDFATGFTAARRLAAASGAGSFYEAAFRHALTVIEREEVNGADPMLVAEAVRQVLGEDDPPVRRAVVGEAQAGLPDAIRNLPPERLERMIHEAFAPPER